MSGWNLSSTSFSILLSVALKSSVVFGAAWLIAFLLRRRSAAARHLVWTAAAAGALAIPLFTFSLPSLHIPGSAAFFPLNTDLVFQVSGSATAEDPGLPDPLAAPQPQPTRSIPWEPALRSILMLIWAAGTALLWMQMLAGYAAMSRIRRRAAKLALYEGIPVLETAAGGMPMTFGLRHPVIFLPADAADWSDDRRRLVLLHEIAHIRRGDLTSHLLARLALGLNWWNPLAWLAWREFLKERERAADDLVLNAGARASDYAAHLLEVARSLQSARPTAWAAVAMARRSQIEGRLLAILDSGVNRKEAGRAAVVATAFLAVVLVAPFAAMRAQNPVTQPPPEVEATIRTATAQKNYQMLEEAAAAYDKLQKYDVEQGLLEAALAIRGDVSGQQSGAYAEGLVKLAELSLKRRNYGDAEALYTKAVGLGDRPEIAPALLYLGKRAYGKNNATAIDLLQRALNVAPTGPTAGPAMTWLALVKQATPDGAAEAESLYQRAIAAEDANSNEAAITTELYARFLRQQGRTAEAVDMESKGRSIRQARANERVSVSLNGNVAPSLSANVFKAGNGVAPPVLLHKVEPEYTEEARAAKLAGTVLVYMEVTPDGIAQNIRIMRSLGLGLDEKAIEAISQWQFRPGMKDGKPVTVAATVEVNFKLL